MVHRKERYIHGGAVMSLNHKDNLLTVYPYMLITELLNDSESVWVKVLRNKTFHFMDSLVARTNTTVNRKVQGVPQLKSQPTPDTNKNYIFL